MTPDSIAPFAALLVGTEPPIDLDAFAVGYAHGSVTTAIRYLERGQTAWALQELRRALPHLDAAMAPELRADVRFRP